MQWVQPQYRFAFQSECIHGIGICAVPHLCAYASLWHNFGILYKNRQVQASYTEMASGEDSPECATLCELSSTLEVGVQSDLTRIATEAFSCSLFGVNEWDDVLDAWLGKSQKGGSTYTDSTMQGHGIPGFFYDFKTKSLHKGI